jgi:hypothetical protein
MITTRIPFARVARVTELDSLEDCAEETTGKDANSRPETKTKGKKRFNFIHNS